MIRFQSKIRFQPHFFVVGLFALSTLSILAAPNTNPAESANQAKNLARMSGAQIECITPDGHVTRVTPVAPQSGQTSASITDDDTVSCSLQEGETSFVIALPDAATLDRFTFLNENAVACGELKIAVSNYRLAANSNKWTPVEGIIPFSHKRTFDLSLLGVEARFVKLSFRVEKKNRIAAGEQSVKESGKDTAAVDFNPHAVRNGVPHWTPTALQLFAVNNVALKSLSGESPRDFSNSLGRLADPILGVVSP